MIGKLRNYRGLVALLMIVALMVSVVGFAPNFGLAKSDFGGEFYAGKTPKYIFMFIGDGMSFAQVSTAEMFLGKQPMNPKPHQLNFTKFPVHGSLMTQDSTSFIPDSASTATSLASGYKTLSGVINMNESTTTKYKPITENLKENGYKIGIVTSVPITHATPAAYYAKVPHRNQTYEIGKQLAASGFDYFGGGDFDQKTGPNKDQKHIYEVVADAGYKIVNTKDEIMALNNKSGKVVAISPVLDGTAMKYEIDRDKAAGELSLSDFVKKGIDVLVDKPNSPNPFFMMVESGKIDWANHANDAAASIHDTIAFADSVQVALDFYNKHPNDTLILVTADHECGGLSIGFANTEYSTYFDKLKPVKMSYVEFNKIVKQYKDSKPSEPKLADLMPHITANYGITGFTPYETSLLQAALNRTMNPIAYKDMSEQEKILYGSYDPFTVKLCHIVNSRAGLAFTTYSHTGLPVPVYAVGVGAEIFDGFYDNTGIYHKLAAISKIKLKKAA